MRILPLILLAVALAMPATGLLGLSGCKSDEPAPEAEAPPEAATKKGKATDEAGEPDDEPEAKTKKGGATAKAKKGEAAKAKKGEAAARKGEAAKGEAAARKGEAAKDDTGEEQAAPANGARKAGAEVAAARAKAPERPAARAEAAEAVEAGGEAEAPQPGRWGKVPEAAAGGAAAPRAGAVVPRPAEPAAERLAAPKRVAPPTEIPRTAAVPAGRELEATGPGASELAAARAAATQAAQAQAEADRAQAVKAPAARTLPARPAGPPLAIDHAITASELKVLTGGKAFKRGDLAGRPADPTHAALYYAPAKGSAYGLGVQVWYEPTIRETRARYEAMKSTYPNVQETGNVTNYTFFAFWNDVYYLVFMGLKQRLVISVTASSETLTPNQLFSVATKVRDRLIH